MPPSLIKPGDWGTLLGAAVLTTWLALTFWHGGAADKAVIRSGGKVFREVSLRRDIVISVPGPLGVSKIAIHNQQARVASDPSPRQLCVHQGWLKQAGEIAICLPNQVSVELVGASRSYDSLSY
jgi:hypothetical protein